MYDTVVSSMNDAMASPMAGFHRARVHGVVREFVNGAVHGVIHGVVRDVV